MVAPSAFPLSGAGTRTLFIVEYAIIRLFALEYAAAWTLATDSAGHVNLLSFG